MSNELVDIDVLIEKASKGNEKAFQELYNHFSGQMYSLCMRYASDADECNDFFQEGCIKVYKNLPNYRFEGAFLGWG